MSSGMPYQSSTTHGEPWITAKRSQKLGSRSDCELCLFESSFATNRKGGNGSQTASRVDERDRYRLRMHAVNQSSASRRLAWAGEKLRDFGADQHRS